MRGFHLPSQSGQRMRLGQSATLKVNATLGRYRNVLWIIGDGRSGTTWIQELLCWSRRYRMMYEPFHPSSGHAAEIFTPNLFIHPNDRDSTKLAIAADVFSGRYVHPNVDRDNKHVFYRGIVVKDIFAHLFAPWAVAHFPHVKPILVVRNPFDVALSKHGRQDWVWTTDAREFLFQQPLLESCLEPYVDVILDSPDDFIHQQVLVWSIMHFVLFRYVDASRVYFLRYEDVVENPRSELRRLQIFASCPGERPPRPITCRRLARPSRGSSERRQRSAQDVTPWFDRLSTAQIEQGLQTLDRFGLLSFAGLDGTALRGVRARARGLPRA